jgi:hypothetical protein
MSGVFPGAWQSKQLRRWLIRSVDPAGVQAEPMLSLHQPSEAAICTDETKENIGDMSPDTSAKSRAQGDLKLIDLLWNVERKQYALFPFVGTSIMPSKKMSCLVGLGSLIIWSIFFIIFPPTNMGLLRLLICGLGVSVTPPLYIYELANGYEKAEADWQRKRIVAVAKIKASPNPERHETL